MRPRIRSHLTYANVAATLALVIAVGGASAYAANTVFSSDIVDNQVYSADVRNDTFGGGGLGAADLRAHSVGSSEVTNNALTTGDIRNDSLAGGGLTGVDIRNQSGVDTCTHGTARFGELCVRVANKHHDYFAAGDLCEALELRLPSLGEAQSLARNHDLPNAAENEPFWTEELYKDGTNFLAFTVTDGNSVASVSFVTDEETVCVTTPTN